MRLASLSLELSPPKNMSEEMDLALPNLLTASVLLLGPLEIGAAGLFGLTGQREVSRVIKSYGEVGLVLLGIKVVVPVSGLAGGRQTGDVLVEVLLLPGRLAAAAAAAVARGADVVQPGLGAAPAKIFLLHHLDRADNQHTDSDWTVLNTSKSSKKLSFVLELY